MNFEFDESVHGVENHLEQLRSALAHAYPDLPIVPRRRFVMMANLVDKVLARRKCSTIRFDKHAVEYPAGSVLPLYSVEEGQLHEEATCIADLLLHAVRYERVEDLTDDDAIADGFTSRDDLVDALDNFYGRLSPQDLVCIYAFSVLPKKADHSRGSRPLRNRSWAAAG